MDERTQGAWIIHHTDKLQDMKYAANDYENINLAGKCGLLLSSLAATEEMSISQEKLNALAKAANISLKMELPTILDKLEKQKLIISDSTRVYIIGLTNAVIKLASSVIANQSIATALKREVDKQTKYRSVEILSDYFAKTANMNSLFKNASLFELHAYSQVVTTPLKLPIELQSIIGLLTDFFRMDRKQILNL